MKNRKHLIGRLTACFVVMGLSMTAGAAIKDTKHNLGSSGTSVNRTDGTAEICVFCHTPHASNTVVTAAPLWNKKVNSGTYTVYTSSTLDSTTAQPGGISLACLSCHDGTQAMDNMINQPGSGGWTSGSGARLSGTWVGTVGADGKMNASSVAMLGTDLNNDHPIGIKYCGSATWAGGDGTNGVCTDKDFNGYYKNSSNSGGFVDGPTGTGGTREKSDMWLYAGSGGTLMVECASCHDPHSGNATFLRTVNTGSAVCLACHDK